jgi:hypothetical protein
VPYVKCVPCKIRVSVAPGTDPAARSCPGCGQPLEAVVKLDEVLGFRSPNVYDSPVPPRLAERMADISGGRAAAEAQLDADQWLNGGGSPPPSPIA